MVSAWLQGDPGRGTAKPLCVPGSFGRPQGHHLGVRPAGLLRATDPQHVPVVRAYDAAHAGVGIADADCVVCQVQRLLHAQAVQHPAAHGGLL